MCVQCDSTCLKCDGSAVSDCLECPTYLIKNPPIIGIKGLCLEYC